MACERNRSRNVLAWQMYPRPDGVAYEAEDLAEEAAVVALFEACQILEAAVLARGWQFLFKTYGMDGLLRINRRSGWFDEEDDDEARVCLIEAARDSGYDPIEDVFGTCDSETGSFLPDET